MNSPRMLWLEDDPELAVAAIQRELTKQKVVLFPTDTVYGLLASHSSKAAYYQIFAIKKRDQSKPLQLLTPPQSGMAAEIRNAIAEATDVLREFNAGTATVILAAELLTRFPPEASQIQPGAVGIRCTQSPELIKVLQGLNQHQLAWASSANRSTEPALSSPAAAIDWLADIDPKPALAVLSRRELKGQPSSVYQFTPSHGCEQLR